MCGIAGYLTLANGAETSKSVALAMADSIVHRGPDDNGAWSEGPIALAHRRLSILDLSPAGHQPMESSCGRYVIAYNGEIYNFRYLRKELDSSFSASGMSHEWRGHSDTEVLLAGICCWGFRRTLDKLVGMFAIALWDRKEQVLFLARDRFGEKPLYYGRVGNVIVFGSELRALKKHPDWNGDIDRGSLSLLLRHNYIPAPYSIYKNVKKIVPGTFLRISTAGDVRPETYWSLVDVAAQAQGQKFAHSDESAVDELEHRLSRSISDQMVADVPLGAFLSGGIDSSVVVALMQAQSSRPIRTFSIGFHEENFNEAQHAKRVAEHLGTDHTELYVTSQQAMDVIPSLPTLYDEPFSDSSQVPTFLVSQLAKQHVTVSLSGDGGDELFGGYGRYFFANDAYKQMKRLPTGVRGLLAGGVKCLSPEAWTALSRFIKPFLPARYRYDNFGDKLHKLANGLGADGVEAIYLQMLSHWSAPSELVRDGYEPQTWITNPNPGISVDSFFERLMLLDSVSYLPDDILVKVDRAAMGVSLETRVPMLDHRVAEFAWSLPFDMKVRDNNGKWILRQVLNRHVPKEITERPKMGFGVPIDIWLRSPLKEWAGDLLSSEKIRSEGFFDPAPIEEKWRQHLSGEANWQYLLWDVLMFQAWHDSNR